jgi:serine-type anaerobic sulfatase-maturating enzyme
VSSIQYMTPLTPARQPFHVLCKPIGPLCNLACEYCFYLEKLKLFPETRGSEFRMSDETLEEFTRQYIECQHPAALEVNFAWQGGEPTLMGIDFYRRAVELQRKYRRQDQKISNALQTNGVLLDDEWAAFLKENEFLVGISIDGDRALHDRFRKDREGRGSFDRVMQGLEALKRGGVEFNTLTVVQSDNGNRPREVYQFLKEIGSTFLQFIPIVEPLDSGGVSERTVRPKQWGSFLIQVFDEWLKEDVGRIYVQHFDMMLGIYMGQPASVCVHAPTCGRAVALEHDGSLYSCDHFVTLEHRLGSIFGQSLSEMIDGGFQTSFGQHKSGGLPSMCRRCEYLKFCYGGCPSDRCKKTPRGEAGLNWNCEGYRMFYDHSRPVFEAMARALGQRMPASEYRRFLDPPREDGQEPGRNDPCPCGSGRKYKHCHGR